MKKEKQPPNPKTLSPMVQKVLLLCASLSLCALIFLFVGQRTALQPEDAKIFLITPSPSGTPPVPTPYGVREHVIVEVLSDIGLDVEKLEDTPHAYAFYTEGDEGRHIVEFWMVDGYVRGFTISLRLPPIPDAPGKKATPREYGEYDVALSQYQAHISEQQRFLSVLISALASPLDKEGSVSPATLLEWEAETNRMYTENGTYTGNAGRFSFAASNTEGDLLTIAFGRT